MLGTSLHLNVCAVAFMLLCSIVVCRTQSDTADANAVKRRSEPKTGNPLQKSEQLPALPVAEEKQKSKETSILSTKSAGEEKKKSKQSSDLPDKSVVAEKKTDIKDIKTLSNVTQNSSVTVTDNVTGGVSAGAGPAKLNPGALLRGFYVFVGLSAIVVIYIVVRAISVRRKKTTVRKYGILANREDVEMTPLGAEEDEEDTTLFDLSNQGRR